MPSGGFRRSRISTGAQIADGIITARKFATDLQSDNYDGDGKGSPGTQGWYIGREDGFAEFEDALFRGIIEGSTITGGLFRTAESPNRRIELTSNFANHIRFFTGDSAETNHGFIEVSDGFTSAVGAWGRLLIRSPELDVAPSSIDLGGDGGGFTVGALWSFINSGLIVGDFPAGGTPSHGDLEVTNDVEIGGNVDVLGTVEASDLRGNVNHIETLFPGADTSFEVDISDIGSTYYRIDIDIRSRVINSGFSVKFMEAGWNSGFSGSDGTLLRYDASNIVQERKVNDPVRIGASPGPDSTVSSWWGHCRVSVMGVPADRYSLTGMGAATWTTASTGMQTMIPNVQSRPTSPSTLHVRHEGGGTFQNGSRVDVRGHLL